LQGDTSAFKIAKRTPVFTGSLNGVVLGTDEHLFENHLAGAKGLERAGPIEPSELSIPPDG